MIVSTGGGLADYSAPPTAFALKMRPWLMTLFGLLTCVAGARLAAFDVTGGFFLAVASLMGYLAVRKGVNAGWMLVLAVALFSNALLDAFLVLALAMKLNWQLVAHNESWLSNVARIFVIVGPVLEMAAACLCWNVYKDHLSNMSSSEAFLLDPEQTVQPAGYSSLGGQSTSRASVHQEGAASRSFAAFSGSGHRLSV
ncbi:unnamed protein product [Polarella glacialis]|uniref:Uncharacterized protein n=1 Tax=Polarella glacialis TaxID=89957 RepID=A0A813LE40_POLGL|nr:unnamed protein product [Polarella glacialis]